MVQKAAAPAPNSRRMARCLQAPTGAKTAPDRLRPETELIELTPHGGTERETASGGTLRQVRQSLLSSRCATDVL